MNKTIYMTYKKEVPELVFSRWKDLNSDYNIDFSLDKDCIIFLKTHFNDYVADLFNKIPLGMFKADLWRLCKLYVHGGVYADVDLVPYINIDELDKSITFYSCLSIDSNCIFQAFMVSKPKNPLILNFLVSFLLNNPYKIINGPTIDMYDCLKHNLNHIVSDKKYEIEEVKILVKIGSSDINTKLVNLHYFPDIDHTITLCKNEFKDTFNFMIKNNFLIVNRTDERTGWGHDHSVNICIKSNESIYLFKENIGTTWIDSYVTFDNKKILESRDLNYFSNKGW